MNTKMKIGEQMTVAILVALPFAAFARSVTVPTLPPSGFADTESVTNLAIVVSHENMGRLDVVLAANATPSNNVQIAFGVDANRNGALEPMETDAVLGWDCGAWFVRDERAEWSRRWTRAAGANNLCASLHIASQQACALDVSDGDALFSGRTPEIPPTLFNPNWNCLRVTSRGHALREESVTVSPRRNALMLQVR